MSQFPNLNDPGAAPTPFGAAPAYPPPRRSSPWLWILLGVGGVGAVICCGCAGITMFAFTQGSQMMANKLKDQLNADPAAQEHLGTVESATMDIMETAKAAPDFPGRNIILFRAKGSKGSGNVIGDSPRGGQQEITNAVLVLPDGQKVELGF